MRKMIHKANTRGVADFGWLHSKHTFSFSSYYNPNRMQFGALRVLNDDIVAPDMGFGTHGHENMEIVSIPISGELAHRDSTGNAEIGIKPRYEQKLFEVSERKNKLQTVVSPVKNSDAVWINQDSYFSLANLEQGKELEYKMNLAGNGVYLFLIEGSITFDGEIFEKRDGIGISETNSFNLQAKENSEILFIEVPMS